MSRRVFQEFDQFAEAISGVAGRFLPTGRPQTDWWVEVVPVGRLAVQQIQIGGATTFAGDGRDHGLTIGIPIDVPQRVRIDGTSLDDRSFIAVKEGQPFTFAATHSTRWAGVTIPGDELTSEHLLQTSQRIQATLASSATLAVCDPARVKWLRGTICRLCTDTSTRAQPLGDCAARALEEAIILAATQMLGFSDGTDSLRRGRPRIARERVIARVLELFDASDGAPLLLRDLCATARVSERTLRIIFHDYFGVGPMRLVKVRQLHEIRNALLLADPLRDTVTDVLARFGIYDLTVFARNYRTLYDELPSQTLHRAAPLSLDAKLRSTTWFRYATQKFGQPLLETEAHRAFPVIHAELTGAVSQTRRSSPRR